MNITKEQKEVFDREGYLFFPSIFSQKEVQNLLHAVPQLYKIREEYNFREKILGKKRYPSLSKNSFCSFVMFI